MPSPLPRTNQPGATNARKPTEAEIAAAAHHIHVQNGSLHGHDLDDWLKAEQLLTQHLEVAPDLNSHSPQATVQPPSPDEIPPAHTAPKANRDDIRRQTTAFRPASRQTRPSKHTARTNA